MAIVMVKVEDMKYCTYGLTATTHNSLTLFHLVEALTIVRYRDIKSVEEGEAMLMFMVSKSYNLVVRIVVKGIFAGSCLLYCNQ